MRSLACLGLMFAGGVLFSDTGPASANLILKPTDASLVNYVRSPDGQYVGGIYRKVGAAGNPDRQGLLAWFKTIDQTQAQAAQRLKGDHFQWFQIVTQSDGVGVYADGSPLVAPFIDPPMGGTGDDPKTPGNDGNWFDALPWYWDESSAPAGASPSPLFQLSDHVQSPDLVEGELEMIDFPNRPTNTEGMLSFETYLVCVDAAGDLRRLGGGFKWDWTKPAGSDVSNANYIQTMLFEPKNQYGTPDINGGEPKEWLFYGDGNGGFFTPPGGGEAGQLIAGSPISFATTVDTSSAGAFMLSFEHWFQTTTGTLEVLLDGHVLLTLDAPSVLPTEFTTHAIMISDLALRGLNDVELAFRLDGNTGSEVWIDNVYTMEAVSVPIPEPAVLFTLLSLITVKESKRPGRMPGRVLSRSAKFRPTSCAQTPSKCL